MNLNDAWNEWDEQVNSLNIMQVEYWYTCDICTATGFAPFPLWRCRCCGSELVTLLGIRYAND